MAGFFFTKQYINKDLSLLDVLLLQPTFRVAVKIMSYTLVRLCAASSLFTLYLFLAFLRSILPYVFANALALLSNSGRAKLIRRGRKWREWRDQTAASQLNGTFRFSGNDLESREVYGITQKRLHDVWPVNREYFEVCGGRICVVHERPTGKPKRQVVLMHGNPSWSYMYRNVRYATKEKLRVETEISSQVLSHLIDQGYEVFALDLFGMGGSEKPLNPELVTFELQMRVMVQLYETYNLQGTYILAHDWGGAVSLCTIPILSKGACHGLFLLNSFFPARPSDISLHCYLLYICWLSCQGVFDGFLPEELIMRFMAPNISTHVAKGFAAPFNCIKSKATVKKFAYLVPGMPEFIYRLVESNFGELIDGMCPRNACSSLWAQARLRIRDKSVRVAWGSGGLDVKAEVAFGVLDPLLIDFFDVLIGTIETKCNRPRGYWIGGAGHYATEERPDDIAKLFTEFAAPVAKKNGLG